MNVPDQKPQIAYFSDKRAKINLIKAGLGQKFQVTEVMGVSHVDEALDALKQIQPDYVLIDPDLPHVDHNALYQHIQADPTLSGIQILVIRDKEADNEDT